MGEAASALVPAAAGSRRHLCQLHHASLCGQPAVAWVVGRRTAGSFRTVIGYEADRAPAGAQRVCADCLGRMATSLARQFGDD